MFKLKSTGLHSMTPPETKEEGTPLPRRSERVRNLPEKDFSTVSDTDDSDGEVEQASILLGLSTGGVNRKRKRNLDLVSEENIMRGRSNLNISSEAASPETLFVHLRTHEKYAQADEPAEFKCLPCDNKFRTIALLKQHQTMKVHKNKVEKGSSVNDSSGLKDELKYECDQCNKKFRFRCHLLRHQREVHTEELAYECSLCDKKFKSEISLRQHQKAGYHLKREKSQLSDLEMSDSEASEGVEEKRPSLKTSTSTLNLAENEDSSWELDCNICGKVLATKQNLRLHQMLHNGDLPFECFTCQRKFQTKGIYFHHLESKKHKELVLKNGKEKRARNNVENKSPPDVENGTEPLVKCEVPFMGTSIPADGNAINDSNIQCGLGIMNHFSFQSPTVHPPAAPVDNKVNVLPHFQENIAPGNFQVGSFQPQNDPGWGYLAYSQFPFLFPPYQHLPPQAYHYHNVGVYQGGIPWNLGALQNNYLPMTLQPDSRMPLEHQQAENGVGTFFYNPHAG